MKRILIVGAGLAGSVLAHTLHENGVQVTLLDGRFPDSATRIAAGVINPITGRRFVKTWMLEEMYPVAKAFYQRIERMAGCGKLWNELPILRLLPDHKTFNDWCARAGDPDYAPWMDTPDAAVVRDWITHLVGENQLGLIRGSAQVNFGALCAFSRAFFSEKGQFIEERLPYSAIPRLRKKYDFIVFSEGYRAFQNPFFSNMPWQPAKGEVLLLQWNGSGQPPESAMLKKEVTLVPLGGGRYWLGANYEWFFDDALPTSSVREMLFASLCEMIPDGFQIIGHQAAIRPTARYHRPFLGFHPDFPDLVQFNALGTKGTLLAPYWAADLVGRLVGVSPK